MNENENENENELELDGVVGRRTRRIVGIAGTGVVALLAAAVTLVAIVSGQRGSAGTGIPSVAAPTPAAQPASSPPVVKVPDPGETPAVQAERVAATYRGSPADAPNGRPVMSSEFVVCDLRAVVPGAPKNALVTTFASQGRLDAPLTAGDLEDACLSVPILVTGFDGRAPTAAVIDRAGARGGPAELCEADVRGPVYDPQTPVVQLVVKPEVVFGEGGRAGAGLRSASTGLLDDVNARRATELKLRSGPPRLPELRPVRGLGRSGHGRGDGIRHPGPRAGAAAGYGDAAVRRTLLRRLGRTTGGAGLTVPRLVSGPWW
jgi:hypothetical protein